MITLRRGARDGAEPLAPITLHRELIGHREAQMAEYFLHVLTASRSLATVQTSQDLAFRVTSL